MQAGLQMAGSFALCIGRSPFSEMEPRSGGIELKARQNGRGDPVRIKRSPFSEMEPQSGGIELKHVGSDGGKSSAQITS